MNSSEESALSSIRAAIDAALRSRLKLHEARVELISHSRQGEEKSEFERALLEASVESERAIHALNQQLLTAGSP